MPDTKKSKTKTVAGKSSSTPADLKAALAKSAAARAAFEKLAPSHQREYTTWIGEAKRPETRARRIEQTIARLESGQK